MSGRLVGLLLTAVCLLPQGTVAAIWNDAAVEAAAKPAHDPYHQARRLDADMPALRAVLQSAPLLDVNQVIVDPQQGARITLPMPDGSMRTFYLFESPIMEHELARKYPQISTYKVRALDDAGVSGRLSIGPRGFHGYVHTAKGQVFIDPTGASDSGRYISYYKHDVAGDAAHSFACGASRDAEASPVAELKALYDAQLAAESRTLARTNNNELLTYRLAVATTGEYSVAVDPVGPDKPDVMAEITNAINRVNEIYERDAGIRLLLIANNDDVIYLNSATDPYSNFSPSLLLSQNQTTLDSVIGTANYDIGHVFSTGGGGLAAFEVVCVAGAKARGETGAANPVGDPFYIDFVAHEIGHQFGADHTFNGTTDACNGNRWAATAFEPGSGSTIMSYAGICGAENVQTLADATFHAGSIEQIVAYSRGATGSSCAGTPAWTNILPTVNAGADFTIPARTAFTLTGSAADADGDTLVYSWDQMDAGVATTASTYGSDLGSNALFRSFEPQTDNAFSRTFPQLSTLHAGSSDPAETLPTTSRSMNFRLTVRDLDAMSVGKGGVADDDMVITVDGNAGPFSVIQPNTAVTLNTLQPQLIEWNTACTELAPVNCAFVDIALSTNGGASYDAVVISNTLNDGAEMMSIPPTTSGNARIKVSCSDNIFFDISDSEFALAQDGSGITLVASGTPASCNDPTGGVVVTGNGIDVEPNDTTDLANVITIPVVIEGGVNSASDLFDVFSFVAGSAAYDFVLSDYGSNDLDLLLLDSNGNQLGASDSFSDPTESISLGLAAGQTYYIVVVGFETFGVDSPYTLTISEKAAAPAAGGGDSGGAMGAWLLFALLALAMRCQWFSKLSALQCMRR